MLRKYYWKGVVVFCLGLSIFLLKRPGFEGDTLSLLEYVFAAKKCILQGQYVACPEVGAFPLFQFLPSLILALLGASVGLIVRVLAYGSFACFVLSFWIVFKALKKKSEALAWLGVLILSSGYYLRYSNLSFGEMGSAFFILLFIVNALLKRSTVSICIPLFIAGVTKEVAFIFLLPLAFVCFYVNGGVKEAKKKLPPTVITLLLSVLCNSALNYFRYGTVKNSGYINPINFVSDLSMQLSYFFAIWFSPTGGVALYWTSGFMLLLAVFRLQFSLSFSKKLPFLIVSLVLVALTLGFAKWYTPLGGYAWGSRLILPWLPGVFFLLLWTYSKELLGLLRCWSQNRYLMGTLAGVVCLSAFPQFAILFRHSLIGQVMDRTGCPSNPNYLAQMHCVFWPPHWGIFHLFLPFPRFDLFCLQIFCCTVLLAMMTKIREALPERLKEEGTSHEPI